MSAWLVVLAVLGSYRLTRLVTFDAILDAPRSWVYAKAPAKVAELIACPFCIGFWIAGAVVGVVWAVNGLPLPILAWFGVAGGSALIFEFVPREG